MKVTLQILAEDIRNSEYIRSSDCAISRAIRRAIPGTELVEKGGTIGYWGFATSLMETPQELGKKVRGMYRYVEEEKGIKDIGDENQSPWRALPLVPQDFIFEIDIPLNQEL